MPVPPRQATEHALCLCDLCAFVVYSPPHDPPQHWQDASATQDKLQNTPSAFVISVLLWFTPLLTIRHNTGKMPVPPDTSYRKGLCFCDLCAFVVYSPPHDPPQHWQDASATQDKLRHFVFARFLSGRLWLATDLLHQRIDSRFNNLLRTLQAFSKLLFHFL